MHVWTKTCNVLNLLGKYTVKNYIFVSFSHLAVSDGINAEIQEIVFPL